MVFIYLSQYPNNFLVAEPGNGAIEDADCEIVDRFDYIGTDWRLARAIDHANAISAGIIEDADELLISFDFVANRVTGGRYDASETLFSSDVIQIYLTGGCYASEALFSLTVDPDVIQIYLNRMNVHSELT